MREKINRLARGIVETEYEKLVVGVNEIEESVAAGKITPCTIGVAFEGTSPGKGLAYSTDRRVVISSKNFGGSHCTIEFQVDATHSEPGSSITGELQLITNFGERQIPFSFTILRTEENEPESKLDTIEHFAQLARQDAAVAAGIFEKKDFLAMPFMNSLKLQALYEGLAGRANKRLSLEEFLVGGKAKSKVKLKVGNKKRRYQKGEEPTIGDSIHIRKNTWGYTNARISADTGFIEIDRTQITDDDFVGESYDLGFVIHTDRLHAGDNPGRITITTIEQKFSVDIVVSAEKRIPSPETIFRRQYLTYTNLYVNYLTGRFEERLLLNEMQTELSRMRGIMPETPDIILVYQAEVYCLQGRPDQAENLINEVRPRLNPRRDTDVSVYCYYLYVKYLMTKSEDIADALAKTLERLSSQGRLSDICFFLYSRFNRVYQENPALLLTNLKGRYQQGCFSPFLYEKACEVFNEEPTLLRTIDGFELQVLNFGVKRRMVTERAAVRMALLVPHEKRFRSLFFHVLVKLYESYPLKSILEGILSLLIMADKRDKEYFIWYEKGVEADIRLTRLYEYYLYSIPEDNKKELPRQLLLYFSYNSSLASEARAFIYRYILTYCKTDEQLYGLYRKQMEEFVVTQLFRSNISEDMIALYEELIYPSMIDQKIAKCLPMALFAAKITCAHTEMKQAVILYEELCGEVRVPIIDGVAYAPVYLKNCQILLQDAYGNRYSSIPYTMRRMMKNEDLADICSRLNRENDYLLLSESQMLEQRKVHGAEVSIMKQEVLDRLALRPLYRKRLLTDVISYYYQNPGAPEAESYLLKFREEELEEDDRCILIETLIDRDFIPESFDLVKRYGCMELKASRLMKLCNRMILDYLFEYNEAVMDLALHCFEKERADSVIMEYLCRHYNGSSSLMYQVLLNAKEIRSQLYDLPERLLAQLLFVGSDENLDEAFICYTDSGQPDETLVNAYMVVKCHRYFLRNSEFSSDLAGYIERKMTEEGPLKAFPRICRIAMTCYYANAHSLNRMQKELCTQLVETLLSQEFLFGHFEKLKGVIEFPEEYREKTIVEYRGPEEAVIMEVWQDDAEGEQPVYGRYKMKSTYYECFALSLAVFCDEKLHYKIKAQTGEVLKEGTLNKSPQSYGGYSRIGFLNNIIQKELDGDEAELYRLLDEYAIQDELVKLLF